MLRLLIDGMRRALFGGQPSGTLERSTHMADYQLVLGTSEVIVDEDGNAIAEGTTSVAIADTAVVQLSAADGVLYLSPLAVGVTDVTITRGGVAQTHEVTVVDDFDWSLGPSE